jgi:hypothetical protein
VVHVLVGPLRVVLAQMRVQAEDDLLDRAGGGPIVELFSVRTGSYCPDSPPRKPQK